MRDLVLFILCVVLLAALTALMGLNNPPPADPGFWVGLWHGIVLLGSFPLSLMGDTQVFALTDHNAYVIGFVFGVVSLRGLVALVALAWFLLVGRLFERHKWRLLELWDSIRKRIGKQA